MKIRKYSVKVFSLTFPTDRMLIWTLIETIFLSKQIEEQTAQRYKGYQRLKCGSGGIPPSLNAGRSKKKNNTNPPLVIPGSQLLQRKLPPVFLRKGNLLRNQIF